MGKFSKRKKSFYVGGPRKKQKVEDIVGTVGYLGTCNSFEDRAVREAYDLLNFYANQLYGEESFDKPAAVPAAETEGSSAILDASEDDDEELDMEAALKKEVSSLQEPSASDGVRHLRAPRRFQSIRCTTNNNLYFRTTLEDPLPTLMKAMDDILLTKQQRTKYLMRLLPVHVVCKAYPEKIEKAFTKIVSERFKGEQKSFYLNVKITSNNLITKDQILGVALKVFEELAPECSAVLTKDADVGINVSVLSTNCYIGEAPQFLSKYKRFNLMELANSEADSLNQNAAQDLVKEDSQPKLDKNNSTESKQTEKSDIVPSENKESSDTVALTVKKKPDSVAHTVEENTDTVALTTEENTV